MDRDKLIDIITEANAFYVTDKEDIGIADRYEMSHKLADHLIANGIGDITAENEELKDRCNYIWAIGCDYDGAYPNDATQMRQLVDELVGIAVDGLELTVFCNDEKTEIQPRAVKLRNLKAENARLTEQLKNAVVLPCIKPFNNGNYGIVYEVLEWDNANGFMTRPYDTLPEAEARLAELKEEV